MGVKIQYNLNSKALRDESASLPQAGQERAKIESKGEFSMHERVLKVVQDCEAVCEGTLTAVLGMPDVQARVMQIHLLHDCADICTLTAKYIARCSSFAKHLAHLCAHVCEMCGKHCLMYHSIVAWFAWSVQRNVGLLAG